MSDLGGDAEKVRSTDKLEKGNRTDRLEKVRFLSKCVICVEFL